MGATAYTDALKEKTDQKVIAALREMPMSRSEIQNQTGLSSSAGWWSIDRLLKSGMIKKSDSKKKVFAGEKSHLCICYELAEDSVEMEIRRDRERRVLESLTQHIFRHWQDEALFGEYRRAA